MTRALALVALLLVAAPARAQDAATNERIATARALFESGLAYGNRGQWPEAIDHFRRSVELYPSPNASFNLAYALGQTGERVEAAEIYEQVAGAATAPVELRRQAQQRAQEMRRQTARLTVQLSGSTDGVSVRVGHFVLPPAALGVPIPVDTGPRELRVTRGDDTVARRDFQLSAGQATTLAIVVPAPPSLLESPWLWVIVGAVVVGAGVGIALGVALSGTEPEHDGNLGVVRFP